MKKSTSIIFCALISLLLAACGAAPAVSQDESGAVASQQLVNPWADCKTLEDAVALAGFDITFPDVIDGYTGPLLRAIENEIIEVIYYGDDKTEIRIRKGAGDEDISGDYTAYENSGTINLGELQVNTKGTGDTVSLAVWAADGYTYSISAGHGLSVSDMTNLISAIQ